MSKHKRLTKSTLFFLILLITPKLVLAQPNPPMTFGEWVDFAIERLKTNGVIKLHTGIKPLDRSEICQALEQAQTRIDAGSQISMIDHELFNKLKREFSGDSRRSGGFRINAFPYLSMSPFSFGKPRLSHPKEISIDQDAVFSPSAKVALRYEKRNNFAMHQEFEICRGKNKYLVEGKTASQRLHLWQWNYTADFTRVYLNFALFKFNVRIGRDKLFWGHGYRDALGISDNSPPFDLILLSGNFGAIKAQSFMAQLDEMWHDRSVPTPYRYLADRYLAGHRIDWQFSDRIEFAVSELVLYGGESRGLEWEYFNPILPYYASQYNADWDDNVMFLFDIEVIPVNGGRLYGSALIDDLQYSGDDENAWGMMFGCHLSGFPLDQIDCRIQYAKLNRWLYTHRVIENQYTHFGSIIGHRLGNDSDELFLEFRNYLNADTCIKFNYIFTRQGNATVEDRYLGKDQDLGEVPKKKTHELSAQFLYEQIEGWQVDLRLGYLSSERWFEFAIGYGLNL